MNTGMLYRFEKDKIKALNEYEIGHLANGSIVRPGLNSGCIPCFRYVFQD